MKSWAVYSAPAGAPAPLMVVEWNDAPGMKPIHGEPVFAATLELARAAVPAGLTRHAPTKAKGEPKTLIETWEAPT